MKPDQLAIFRFVTFATLTSVLSLNVLGAGTPPANNPPQSWTKSRASQLVFFAVLEGLYRDGVSDADVDLVVPPGEHGKPTFDRNYFVYACPLCHPAFEAFRLYRQREDFFGFKAPIRTFGPGLDDAIAARLRNPVPAQRRKAVEELINRWVSQRLAMMRLSASEREAITSEMAQGRKQGMGALKQGAQPSSETRTNCPICDGSFGACKLKPN